MTENNVSDVGEAISDTVSTTVTEAASSGGNIFKTIAGALGIDISQLMPPRLLLCLRNRL